MDREAPSGCVMTDIHTAPAYIAAGFDNFEDYSEWLRHDGHRQLNLLMASQTISAAPTFPVSIEATLAEATALVGRLSFLLACAVYGPFAGRAVPDGPDVPVADPNLPAGTGTQGCRS